MKDRIFFKNSSNSKHEKANHIKNMCIIEINKFESYEYEIGFEQVQSKIKFNFK